MGGINFAQVQDGYSLSGESASGATGSALRLVASNGSFLATYSAASNGPTAGGSAHFVLQHSHDNNNWVNIALYTATEAWATAALSNGPYAWVRATVGEVYSAAETGTGQVVVHLRAGVV